MKTQTPPFLYVALDSPSQQANLKFARRLSECNAEGFGFKVNLDSVLSFHRGARTASEFIQELAQMGRPIFVDLKMWNGERTMANVIEGLGEHGVEMVNVYAHAGRKFLKKLKSMLSNQPTKLFALTVLTHYDEGYTREVYGCGFSEAVRRLAVVSVDAGVDGIIVPGTELKNLADINLPKLCPGIRPAWFPDRQANSQEQTITPKEAVALGASYVVVGSVISRAENPHEPLVRILDELRGK